MLKTAATVLFAGSLLFLVHGAPGPPPVGAARHFRFTNETKEPIVELDAAVGGSSRWQSDLLGPDYLMPGGSLPIDIDDPNESCRADIRVVLDDGSERVSRGVDICRAEDYALSLR